MELQTYKGAQIDTRQAARHSHNKEEINEGVSTIRLCAYVPQGGPYTIYLLRPILSSHSESYSGSGCTDVTSHSPRPVKKILIEWNEMRWNNKNEL